MFNKYSSEIFDIVGRHLPEVHYYADDSQLYLSLNPSCASSQDEAVRAMETCIKDVKHWMTSDKLVLNDDKTVSLVTVVTVIASRHILRNVAVLKTPSG